MEAEMTYAQQQPVLLQQGIGNIDLELRAVQRSSYFKSDKDNRAKKAERFVFEYLKRIGGEENLSIESANATLDGFEKAEMVNAKFYLLLMFKEITNKRIEKAKAQIPRVEKEFKQIGGRLNDKEKREFDDFVGNLNSTYSPSAYHASFSQYKIAESIKLLKHLKPLP